MFSKYNKANGNYMNEILYNNTSQIKDSTVKYTKTILK